MSLFLFSKSSCTGVLNGCKPKDKQEKCWVSTDNSYYVFAKHLQGLFGGINAQQARRSQETWVWTQTGESSSWLLQTSSFSLNNICINVQNLFYKRMIGFYNCNQSMHMIFYKMRKTLEMFVELWSFFFNPSLQVPACSEAAAAVALAVPFSYAYTSLTCNFKEA